MSLGAKVTGVDDATFSATGEAFSAILLPNAESTSHKKLQADDVSLGAHAATPKICRPFLTPHSVRSLRIRQEVSGVHCR